MGSYFQTCGLTNLPILGGEKVIVGFLTKTIPRMISQCYPTHTWSLTPFFFDAKYDDYGNVENESGLMFDHMMDTIRKYVVEREQGDNPYHDLPIKKKGLTIQRVIQASSKDRLFVNNLLAQPINIPMKVIYFKKSAMDAFLDSFEYESWTEGRNVNFDFLCKRLATEFESGYYQIDDLGMVVYTGKKSYMNIYGEGISFNSSLGRIKPTNYFKNFFPFHNNDGKIFKDIDPALTAEAIRQYTMHDLLNTYMFELCGSWIPQMYGMTEITVSAHKLREKIVNQEIKALGR